MKAEDNGKPKKLFSTANVTIHRGEILAPTWRGACESESQCTDIDSYILQIKENVERDSTVEPKFCVEGVHKAVHNLEVGNNPETNTRNDFRATFNQTDTLCMHVSVAADQLRYGDPSTYVLGLRATVSVLCT